MNKVPCEIIRDLLPCYVDGLLSDVSRRLVEEHIAVCPKCRRALDDLRRAREKQADGRLSSDKDELNYLEKQKNNIFRTKIISITAAAVIAALFWGFAHWMSYPIRPDCGNAAAYIELTTIQDEYGYGYAPVPVTVYDSFRLNDKYSYVLFEKNGLLMYGRLESDFTGWHKKPYGSYVGNTVEPYFTVELIGTEEERYLVFAGRNPDLEIAGAKIEMEGQTFEIDIPEKAAFIRMIPVNRSLGYASHGPAVPGRTSDESAAEGAEESIFKEWKLTETPQIKVFDAEGRDITAKYIAVDEKKYPVAPDLGNLKTCVEDFYAELSVYSEDADIQVRYFLPLGLRQFALTEYNGSLNVLRLKRSTTGRYCVDGLATGIITNGKPKVTWTTFKGKSYMVFGCANCPTYAGRVRFVLYDWRNNSVEAYEAELPEDRPEGYCLVAFEAEKKFDATVQPMEGLYLPPKK